MVNRRQFVATAGAMAAAASARPVLGMFAGHETDLALDPLDTMIRLRARTDGELSIAWLDARRELVFNGEIAPFCGVYALVLAKFRQNGNAWVGNTVEITYYYDPTTGERLKTTHLPGASGPIEVPIYRAGPQDVRFKQSLDEWERHEPKGSGAASEAFAPASDVHLVRGVHDPYVLDGTLYLRADEYGRVYTDKSKPPAVYYREWIVWKAKAEDVLETTNPDVPSSFSYAAASGIRPWMKLPSDRGHTISNGIGAKVETVDELPPQLIQLLSENDPQALEAPEAYFA